jgi:hypothetical protein
MNDQAEQAEDGNDAKNAEKPPTGNAASVLRNFNGDGAFLEKGGN